MQLLKLIPKQGWSKVKDLPSLYMAKCVYTPDERAFVIGGARDKTNKTTINDTVEFV